MAWRKWLLVIFVLLIAVMVAGGWWVHRTWMCPQAVRQAVLDELARRLPGAAVQLESADFRLFGGVRLRNLSLARQDDPGASPFAVLSDVICYPDKEQLSRGRLVLRKIAIERPKLTLVRRSDGVWNLSGLAAPEQCPAEAGVILEIRQASLVVHDEAQAASRFHFSNIDVALVPQEAARNGRGMTRLYKLRLTGESNLAGPFSLEGTFNPVTEELAVAYHIPQMQLRPQIIHQLTDCFCAKPDAPPELEGMAAVEGTIAYHPGAANPWTHSTRVALRQGELRHAMLPIPLQQLEGTAIIDGGHLRIERLAGTVSGGRITVTGDAALGAGGLRGEFEARVNEFPVTESLYDKLPPQSRKLCHDFHPLGPLSLIATLTIADGKLDVPQYLVQLRGLTIVFSDFPYPMQDLTGTMSYSEANDPPTLRLNLVGLANGRPVAIKGKVFGPGLRLGCDWKPGQELEIKGDNIAIDDKFYTALSPYPKTLRVAREFHPRGLVDIRAEIRRPPATNSTQKPRPSHHLTLCFHDAAFCYDQFPLPQEDVRGTLELWLPEEDWHFHDFVGKHQSGTFSGWAQSRHPAVISGAGQHSAERCEPRVTIDIQGSNVLLNREVESALDSEMHEAWKHFQPAGRADCRAIVQLCGDARPELDLTVDARGCGMRPSCFPYQLQVTKGKFHYAKKRLMIQDLDAWHRDSHITLESARVDLLPQGGSQTALRKLRAYPITVDADFLDAVPGLVRSTFATLQPDQPIRLELTDLIVSDPGVGGRTHYGWDGHVACINCRWHCGVDVADVTGLVALRGTYTDKGLEARGNIELSRATLARQPLRDISGRMFIVNDVLQMDGLGAHLHGGEVNCPLFRVQFADHTKYWLKLAGSKIDLQHFAQEGLNRKGQVRGTADVELTLSGQGSDLSTLQGEGSIKVPDGAHLYDLPLVIDLLTFLSGKLPKGSAFQEGYGAFIIDGERLRVSKLELLGDALSLRGQGEMQVDGSGMNLEMYGLLWGRQLPLLPPLLDQVQPAISKQLLKFRVQGSLGGAQVSAEPLPAIMEPLRALWQRLHE